MRSGRTIGVVTGMLAALLGAAPAQAAALAGSPGISAAAERVTHVSRYGFADYDCRVGRACLAVWDDTTGDWKVFDLFRCGLYHVSNWYYEGGLKNNQTGNAAVRTYGSGGGQIHSYPPNGNNAYDVDDWGPVYSVRPC